MAQVPVQISGLDVLHGQRRQCGQRKGSEYCRPRKTALPSTSQSAHLARPRHSQTNGQERTDRIRH